MSIKQLTSLESIHSEVVDHLKRWPNDINELHGLITTAAFELYKHGKKTVAREVLENRVKAYFGE